MLRRGLVFIGIILALSLLSIYYPYLTGEKSINQQYEKEVVFVERVIDGDTLVDSNGNVYRLLGIDTPEKGEEYHQEAKDFLKQVENENIEILRDWEDLGKYKRKLRYVFYKGRLINIEILEQGLAKAFIIEDLEYKDKILKAEKFAKENCIGLWEKSC